MGNQQGVQTRGQPGTPGSTRTPPMNVGGAVHTNAAPMPVRTRDSRFGATESYQSRTPNDMDTMDSFTPGSRNSNDAMMDVFGNAQYSLSSLGQHPIPGFTDNVGQPKSIFDPLSREAQETGIPTVFEWEGGTAPPETVYVVGSFAGWSMAIPLSRSHSDFSTILYLPKGRHEYKFIVNGEWSYALDKPTTVDASGNVNNVIEVRETDSMFDGYQQELNLNGAQQRPASPPGQYSREYTNTVPKEHYIPSTYEKPAPMLPAHMKAHILIRAPNPLDSIALPVPHHVMLEHVAILSTKDDVMVFGTTTRLYSKFVTHVIYKPFMRRRATSRV